MGANSAGCGSRLVARTIVATAVTVVLVIGELLGATIGGRDAAAAASTKLPGWLHTSGSTITTSANTPYVIKAIAWFGMETSNCAPHGLWTIGLDTGLAKIKSMGFNTVRLPFSNECLAQKATTSVDARTNPTLVGKASLGVMDTVVTRAKAYGLNILLDRHRPDSGSQSPLWYTDRFSEAKWISDWRMLAKRYKKSSNVVGFDLHNEPHAEACWGCGNPRTDWQAAATRAGNAVLAVNPKLLIVIEGVERQSTSNTWWGGGLADVAKTPVKLRVKNRVVYSPHDYPASIYPQSWFSAANYPKNLPRLWDRNWGYLARKNIAPVLVGEFGTKLATASDKKWLTTMVSYLKTNKMSFAFWSFNPNSGDTGGLVEDDWTTSESLKLRYLSPLLRRGTVVKVAEPGRAPGAGPAAAPVPAPAPAPAPAAKPPPATVGKLSAQWQLQSSWSEGYVAQFEVASGSPVSAWTISWPDAAATGIVGAWGMTCTLQPGRSITCRGTDWAGSIAPGQRHTVGLQVASPRAPTSPMLSISQ